MTVEWAYFLGSLALFLTGWAALYGGEGMSKRNKREDRGFWGAVWDTLTCPFVWAIELVLAVLD